MSLPSIVQLAGRYRLEDKIATGGYGQVWRATDIALGRPVAVKLLTALSPLGCWYLEDPAVRGPEVDEHGTHGQALTRRHPLRLFTVGCHRPRPVGEVPHHRAAGPSRICAAAWPAMTRRPSARAARRRYPPSDGEPGGGTDGWAAVFHLGLEYEPR